MIKIFIRYGKKDSLEFCVLWYLVIDFLKLVRL